MFKKIKERKKATERRKEKLIYFCDNINETKVQLELIDAIRNGDVKFGSRNSGISGALNIPYSIDKIKSEFGLIVYSCESSGFGSYSYLFINNKDMIDILKYGSEIALTIQNPEKDYLKK